MHFFYKCIVLYKNVLYIFSIHNYFVSLAFQNQTPTYITLITLLENPWQVYSTSSTHLYRSLVKLSHITTCFKRMFLGHIITLQRFLAIKA